MRYSPPALVSERRRSARSLTLSPRYSVRMAALALPSRSFTSSTTATFAGRGFSKCFLLLVGRARSPWKAGEPLSAPPRTGCLRMDLQLFAASLRRPDQLLIGNSEPGGIDLDAGAHRRRQ